MKAISSVLLFVAAAALFGCSPSAPRITGALASDTAQGLQVTLELPKRSFDVGEQFTAMVRAANLTQEPIAIASPSTNLIEVRLYRPTMAGWEQFKAYPALPMMIQNSWTLAPRQQRTWRVELTVEPDWPTAEDLRMQASLSGRPQPAPMISIRVNPSKSSHE